MLLIGQKWRMWLAGFILLDSYIYHWLMIGYEYVNNNHVTRLNFAVVILAYSSALLWASLMNGPWRSDAISVMKVREDSCRYSLS